MPFVIDASVAASWLRPDEWMTSWHGPGRLKT